MDARHCGEQGCAYRGYGPCENGFVTHPLLPSRRLHVASLARAIALEIGALILAIPLAGCGAGLLGATAELGTATTSAAATTGLDCVGLVRLAPEAAAEMLSATGHSVSWRLVHTTSDGASVADIVQTAPEGVVVDIVIVEDDAIVFVADPGDPAAASPPPPAC